MINPIATTVKELELQNANHYLHNIAETPKDVDKAVEVFLKLIHEEVER